MREAMLAWTTLLGPCKSSTASANLDTCTFTQTDVNRDSRASSALASDDHLLYAFEKTQNHLQYRIFGANSSGTPWRFQDASANLNLSLSRAGILQTPRTTAGHLPGCVGFPHVLKILTGQFLLQKEAYMPVFNSINRQAAPSTNVHFAMGHTLTHDSVRLRRQHSTVCSLRPRISSQDRCSCVRASQGNGQIRDWSSIDRGQPVPHCRPSGRTHNTPMTLHTT